MKKRSLLIIILLLFAVGFAAVSTTLFINGKTGYQTNKEDFDIKFVKAMMNDIDISEISIDDSGKKLTFTTPDFISLGDENKLDFVILNNSTQYDVNISVSCTINNEEYFIIDKFIPSSILAQESEDGHIYLKLKKVSTENITSNISCELNVTASERTSSANSTIEANTIIYKNESEANNDTSLNLELDNLREQIVNFKEEL